MLPEFSITVRNLADVHVVALHGELDLASAEGLANSFVELAGSTLVVDLLDLTFMDSSGIGALVGARNRIRTKGLDELVITRPTAIVQKALEIVGLREWIVEWSQLGMNREREHTYEIVVKGRLSQGLIEATRTDSARFATGTDRPPRRELRPGAPAFLFGLLRDLNIPLISVNVLETAIPKRETGSDLSG